MKLKLILTVAIIALISISCKKNKEVDVSKLRLTSAEFQTQGTTRMLFNYDASGRITQVNSTDGGVTVSLYSIQYAQNRIILSMPSTNNSTTTTTDTIYLFLDGNNRVTKRVNISFFEVKGPQNPQRTYTFDTTTYEYNADNLLAREIKGFYDSTWFNPGTVQTILTRRTGAFNYTINNGDAVSQTGLLTIVGTTRTATTSVSSVRTEEYTETYEYQQGYKNKTDFSNAAVLDELRLQSALPLNPNYAHLPDKISTSSISKDQNGNVTSTNTSSVNIRYTYNVYGYVETKSDPQHPDSKLSFTYGAPN